MARLTHKLALIGYYALISKLPEQRLWRGFNRLRCWYLARVLRVLDTAHGALIGSNVYIGDGRQVSIGAGSRINENVFIQGARIGRNVLIAPGCAVMSKSHRHDRLDVPIVLQGETEAQPVTIKDGAWLGRNVVVMPGVTIGAGAIVGACAFVNRDVPDNAVFAGVPARLIRYRDDKQDH